VIKITVAFALPNKQIEIPLIVEENCTVALAIQRSKISKMFSNIHFSDIQVGIDSKRVGLYTGLQSGDRIEIYRPLHKDPRQIRKLRARKIG